MKLLIAFVGVFALLIVNIILDIVILLKIKNEKK